MTEKKSTKKKEKVKKLKIKRETLKDLDTKSKAKDVKGGLYASADCTRTCNWQC